MARKFPRRGDSSVDFGMLAEAIVYLRSLGRTPPRFRRHLAGAVGLWARGVRQSGAWRPHIAETRGLIDTLIDDIKPRRTVGRARFGAAVRRSARIAGAHLRARAVGRSCAPCHHRQAHQALPQHARLARAFVRGGPRSRLGSSTTLPISTG